mmetsp:Transcript_16389/g.50150  ORF Transcript_16389/g.50150 Transcript_16389/m.50150 type:complete len:386 (-) Transcript_16389:228-1385(-)
MLDPPQTPPTPRRTRQRRRCCAGVPTRGASWAWATRRRAATRQGPWATPCAPCASRPTPSPWPWPPRRTATSPAPSCATARHAPLTSTTPCAPLQAPCTAGPGPHRTARSSRIPSRRARCTRPSLATTRRCCLTLPCSRKRRATAPPPCPRVNTSPTSSLWGRGQCACASRAERASSALAPTATASWATATRRTASGLETASGASSCRPQTWTWACPQTAPVLWLAAPRAAPGGCGTARTSPRRRRRRTSTARGSTWPWPWLRSAQEPRRRPPWAQGREWRSTLARAAPRVKQGARQVCACTRATHGARVVAAAAPLRRVATTRRGGLRDSPRSLLAQGGSQPPSPHLRWWWPCWCGGVHTCLTSTTPWPHSQPRLDGRVWHGCT